MSHIIYYKLSYITKISLCNWFRRRCKKLKKKKIVSQIS